MFKLKHTVCWLLVWSILCTTIPVRISARISAGDASNVSQDGDENAPDKEPEGLRFRLSEGAEQPEARETGSPAPAVRLSESETENVLKRLPPLKQEAEDEREFALRERSLPPPRTGRTINTAFPATSETLPPASSGTKGALEVVRFAPEGEVALAPQLSVTFSQPMVAVTSLAELASESVPVELAPRVEGRWRWLGTKTLLFEPKGRLPMATRFTATVRAGAKSSAGATLAAAKSWSFSTPAPKLRTSYPTGNEAVRRDAVIFISFDQRINPSEVLRTIKVRAGTSVLPVRLATTAEIEADAGVRALVKAETEGRWLALRALRGATNETQAALPPNSNINVTIGPNTPSAEGPRTTGKPQSFSFRTYGALRIVEHQCGSEKPCKPDATWMITFSNPLDTKAFEQSQVRVEPALKGMQASIYGNDLHIDGEAKGRTTYRVTFARTLKDEFGQTLGQDVTITFNVGAADPSLSGESEGFVVLDPSAQPRFSVYTVNLRNLKVSLYGVGPRDWSRYGDYMRYLYGYADPASVKQRTPPGKLLHTQNVAVASVPDELVETSIDLRPALAGETFGHVVLLIESGLDAVVRRRGGRQSVSAWVEVTNIGLDAFVDRTDLLGWATSLKDGTPLSGVELSIYPTQAKALSGVEGLARIPLPQQQTNDGRRLLLARKGRDVAILPEHSDWWTTESNWYKKEPTDSLRWYVFDDRKMYRPDEEVHVKGWLRRVGMGRGGDVGALDATAQSVSYTLKDSRGNEILKNTARLNALGGFDTSFKLPPTVNLGHARLELSLVGGSAVGDGSRQHTHVIQVQEFRRPEFEVTAQASAGPHVVGEQADASVSASYYAGGGLANAEVNWSVRATPAHFTPPNRGDFTFGTWVPWWRASSRREAGQTQTYKGATDASGKHRLRIDFDSVSPARPTNVAATANVSDVNRQTWASTTTLLVHPSDLYVGLRTPRTFVERGQPIVVESIVTDIDGRAVAQTEIRARAVLLEWVFERGEWQQKETNAQECNIRSASDAVRCTFETREGGVYRIKASVIDERERRNESELTIWVAGGKTPPVRGVAQETVELIPARKEYAAGETAEVLVQSPFAPAEGLLTLRRSGIVRTERFRMNTASHTLKIPVEEGFTPNVHVQVDLVGASVRADEEGKPDDKLPLRPAYATGTINLSIPPVARKLSVQATPREKALEPGATTVVDVEVRDAQGRPVAGGEMAVVVVDESVLSLTGYRIPDPLDIFYTQRSADTADRHARQHVLLGNPADLSKAVTTVREFTGRGVARRRVGNVGGGGVGGGGGALVLQEGLAVAPSVKQDARDRDGFSFQFYLGEREEAKEEEEAETIRLRENFDALAVFAAALPTDAQGRAQVTVKLPDNLTRYRVMAVSVAGGKQFGAGESAITARMPLMVRPSAPRFLNFGDQIELPVVVQNQTDAAISVDVAVRAANAELTEGAGRRVRVAANDRVEVRFPVAAVRAGVARFQLGALAGRMTDAAEVQLPVWTPATTEAFATYGELDDGAILQSVRAPAGVFKEFGGLEITTSSTQLQELTDAVIYLSNYPYECSEQLASRVLGIAALRDVLTAFKAKGLPSPKELEAAVERDIKRLRVLQNEDGGFAFWKRGDPSWPYVSIHVAHALQRAKEKRFDVPQAMLDASRRYLRAIETRFPADYSIESKRALIAYALYVRARMGDKDTARALRLINEAGLENLSLEAVGWLLPVLSQVPAAQSQVEAIHRLLNNRVAETAATAHFTTSYSDGERVLLHSARRADGIILEALIGDRPASDLIPKIVRGLLAHRTEGRWLNTQENAFILLALDRCFGTYEKLTPNFVARAWLGDAFAGEHAYRGRTTERQHVQIPMSYLLKESPAQQNLTLGKEGAGRLYYRLGMQYAPASLKLDAADYGFTVERAYEAIDDPTDVRRDTEGAWHIKAGARVRVRLTLSAPTRRYHVALTDPLPAGLEILNPSLAVTGDVPADTKEVKTGGNRWGWWSYQGWFEHQNLRDERAEAFTSLLWEGVYTYSYVARATTPGLFVVPPPKAEEMYHPENFGRGATDRVRIE